MNEREAILAVADACVAQGERFALATVIAVRGSSYRRPGARLLIPETGRPVGVISGGCLEAEAASLGREVLMEGSPRLVTIDHSAEGDELWGSGLGCRGVIDLFVEPSALAAQTVEALRRAADGGATIQLTRLDGQRRHLAEDETAELGAVAREAARDGRPALIGQSVLDPILPPPHLVICGAGPDAEPLAAAGVRLGWRVTVADPRRRALDPDRFPGARLCDAEPKLAAEAIAVDARSGVVLMSHDYLRDAEYLAGFAGRGAAYLGVLGPRDRTNRLLAELAATGTSLTDADRVALRAPAGLDVGADAPEEVAAAVVTEMLAVLRGHRGGPLSGRPGPIHDAGAAG